MYFDIPKQKKGKESQFIEAEMSKINARTENHGADKKVAMDLNFKIQVPVATLDMLSIGDKNDYESLFFDKDGQVKNTGLKKVIFEREFENHYLHISFSTMKTAKEAHRFLADRVCKFSAEPKQGKIIELKFQVQLHPFEESDIGHLIKGLEKQCYIRIEHSQDDLVSETNKAA